MLLEFLIMVMGVIVIGLSIILILTLRNGSTLGDRIVTILVLGDFGRSPRMQFHAMSFAKRDFKVQVVCYGGAKPHRSVTQSRKIIIHTMSDLPVFMNYMPRILAYGVKVIVQFTIVLWHLCKTEKSSHLLLQNPPAIPTLAVAWLFCLFRCTRLVIDWHNYGYSILALSNSSTHPLVRFSKWYEIFFGQLAYYGFCVTRAMQNDLLNTFQISRTSVLHDRPPEMFRPITDQEKHKLFTRLTSSIPAFRSTHDSSSETRLTTNKQDGVSLKPDRPAILVSSTSWTEDEDFSILLQALKKYEEQKLTQTDSKLPDLICIITGKGPQKSYYQNIISEQIWKHISIYTPWLEAEDYPKLLACADLGVSLHTSSSGLDLPMKVVDMFGCCLPVCAMEFKCIDELVKHDENGYTFRTADELYDRLEELFKEFPVKQDKLVSFRENLKTFRVYDWDSNWNDVVLPVFS